MHTLDNYGLCGSHPDSLLMSQGDVADRIVSFLASPDPSVSKTLVKKPKGVKVRVYCVSSKLTRLLAYACSSSSSSIVGSVGL